MQDPLIAENIRFRCLLCGRCHYVAQLFANHLHREHNFLQMQTLMCYHRLTLHCGSKCQFCGFTHSAEPCIPLLNLAVFLINGYGIRGAGRHRHCSEDLGGLAQHRAAETIGSRSTRGQKQGQKQDKKRQKTHSARPDRASRDTSTTAVPTEVLKQLIRLTLRHEDHLNCLMQESQFLIRTQAKGP